MDKQKETTKTDCKKETTKHINDSEIVSSLAAVAQIDKQAKIGHYELKEIMNKTQKNMRLGKKCERTTKTRHTFQD